MIPYYFLIVNYFLYFRKIYTVLYTLVRKGVNRMLGDRIKTLRTARNLSQVELARKLNVSKQSVSNWENNNILPSVDIVKKLALFFSCSTDYLLEMEQDRIMVEFTDLTPEQKAHIQLIINDMRTLNTKK